MRRSIAIVRTGRQQVMSPAGGEKLHVPRVKLAPQRAVIGVIAIQFPKRLDFGLVGAEDANQFRLPLPGEIRELRGVFSDLRG